jgi:small subunit ribosomal protein S20
MAHAKSAIKRNRTNELRRQRNAHVKSRMKTYVKAVEAAIQAKDLDRVKGALPTALREIDRAASKGVIHPNSAARKKSTLQRQAYRLG